MMLEGLRDRRFLGTLELVEEANGLLKRSGARQDRESVSELLNERTVRYYLTEGLLPPPDEKRGLRSVFSYRHLLTLLVIKRLQSEDFPIRKIRDIVEAKSVAELEAIVAPDFGDAGRKKREAQEFLEGLLHRPAPARPRARQEVMPGLELLFKRKSEWQRHELLEGLEINIADDFRLPPSPNILEELVAEFRRLLIKRQ
jgi:DNA-binding transcriptional MerR regulator